MSAAPDAVHWCELHRHTGLHWHSMSLPQSIASFTPVNGAVSVHALLPPPGEVLGQLGAQEYPGPGMPGAAGYVTVCSSHHLFHGSL
jgi:hypothetical protein